MILYTSNIFVVCGDRPQATGIPGHYPYFNK